MPERRDGTPVLVDPEGRTERLKRIPLREKDIDEGWLQKRLHESPEILPINEIDPGFGPLVPIGREIHTPAGPMDNLYISPQGAITLVEAKLWRNPQARREVVGQILDYAKELSLWSYDDLNERAQKFAGKSLWELVSTSGGTLDESRFVDAVSRNLKNGRFLLLIVGDGIREEMERLADFLHNSPDLRFTLALVELQIYRFDDADQYLVMPMIVGRTIEITRAVVRIETTKESEVNVTFESVGESNDSDSQKKRRKLSQEDFFAELVDSGVSEDGQAVARRLHDDIEADDRFVIDFGSASYSIKLRDSVARKLLYTVLVVERTGKVYVYWLDSQLPRGGLPVTLGEEFVANGAQVLGCQVHETHTTVWDGAADLQALADNYIAFKTVIDDFAAAVYADRSS